MGKITVKVSRVQAGLYEYTDANGQEWVIEYCQRRDGFSRNEWHYGPADDPHANQFATLAECVADLEGYLNEIETSKETKMDDKVLRIGKSVVTMELDENNREEIVNEEMSIKACDVEQIMVDMVAGFINNTAASAGQRSQTIEDALYRPGNISTGMAHREAQVNYHNGKAEAYEASVTEFVRAIVSFRTSLKMKAGFSMFRNLLTEALLQLREGETIAKLQTYQNFTYYCERNSRHIARNFVQWILSGAADPENAGQAYCDQCRTNRTMFKLGDGKICESGHKHNAEAADARKEVMSDMTARIAELMAKTKKDLDEVVNLEHNRARMTAHTQVGSYEDWKAAHEAEFGEKTDWRLKVIYRDEVNEIHRAENTYYDIVVRPITFRNQTKEEMVADMIACEFEEKAEVLGVPYRGRGFSEVRRIATQVIRMRKA